MKKMLWVYLCHANFGKDMAIKWNVMGAMVYFISSKRSGVKWDEMMILFTVEVLGSDTFIQFLEG